MLVALARRANIAYRAKNSCVPCRPDVGMKIRSWLIGLLDSWQLVGLAYMQVSVGLLDRRLIWQKIGLTVKACKMVLAANVLRQVVTVEHVETPLNSN